MSNSPEIKPQANGCLATLLPTAWVRNLVVVTVCGLVLLNVLPQLFSSHSSTPPEPPSPPSQSESADIPAKPQATQSRNQSQNVTRSVATRYRLKEGASGWTDPKLVQSYEGEERKLEDKLKTIYADPALAGNNGLVNSVFEPLQKLREEKRNDPRHIDIPSAITLTLEPTDRLDETYCQVHAYNRYERTFWVLRSDLVPIKPEEFIINGNSSQKVGTVTIKILGHVVQAIHEGQIDLDTASQYTFIVFNNNINLSGVIAKNILPNYLIYSIRAGAYHPEFELALPRDPEFEKAHLRGRSLTEFYEQWMRTWPGGIDDPLSATGAIQIVGTEQFTTQSGLLKEVLVVKPVPLPSFSVH